MTKAKTNAPDKAPDDSGPARKDGIIAELRTQVSRLTEDLEQKFDQLVDTRNQVHGLEKSNAALKAENEALHKSLRDAQIAKARAEGRAEVLETFAPEVMAPRSRFPRIHSGEITFQASGSRDRRWFEGG